MKITASHLTLPIALLLMLPGAFSKGSESKQIVSPAYRSHGQARLLDIRSAIKANNLIAVSNILNQGWKIDHLDSHGCTLLIYAVRFNRIQIVRYLLDKKANPWVTDKADALPLFYTPKNSLVHRTLWAAMTSAATKEYLANQAKYNVVYSVSGSAETASVTYSTGDGSTQQENNVSLPWEKRMAASPGTFLYISAQNNGDSGEVEVEIEVKGNYRKSARSDGAYAVASAQDTF